MYIITKLLSYYYYIIIIFFPHDRRGIFMTQSILHDPILVPNKPNIIIIIIIHLSIYNILNKKYIYILIYKCTDMFKIITLLKCCIIL